MTTDRTYTILQSIESGIIMWAGEAASPADALRRFYADVGHPEHTQQAIAAMDDDEVEAIADDLKSIEVPEAVYQMMGGDKLDGTRERAIKIVEQFERRDIDDDSLRAAVEAVEENNAFNDSRWSVWDDASHICHTYNLELGAFERAVLDRAIASDGESLKTDLPLVERVVWGQNFSGSWWNRARAALAD